MAWNPKNHLINRKHVSLQIECLPKMNILNKCQLMCGCRQPNSNNEVSKRHAADENRSKRWKQALENTAYMCFSNAPDRHMKLKQRTKGIRALASLVKKIKKDAGSLSDEELYLLLRCCLFSLKYYSQKIERGEYLMHHWMEIAQFCYINSIAYVPRHQILIAVTSVIRFLDDDDRWQSCDLGIHVLKDLMQVVGDTHKEKVEEEVLSIFINHMAPFCPGKPSSSANSDSHFKSSYSFFKGDETTSIMRNNPLLNMSRVLHGVLAGYKFRDFGDEGWIALDLLITIYISIVNVIEHHEKDTRRDIFAKRMIREWNMTESALIGSLRNFLDDIVSSDIRFKVHMERKSSISPSIDEETGKRMSVVSSCSTGEWDILSQSMIVILQHTLGSEVSQTARNKLLDMLINATRAPLGNRQLRSCLPDKLLDPLLEVARIEDTASTLRSHKLLHHVMDRHSLRVHFVTPRIFREDCEDFKITYDPDDWDYLRQHRKNLYDTLYRNFLTQTNILNNLEALYCTLCLILVEIPCISSAQDIAELVVNVQDAVIGNPNIPAQITKVSAWIHSTVVSVLSLITVIHNLDELGKLVTEVVNRRSQVAPFLIPPLKAKHTIGDITDYQEDLFFSHALVRRCFTNVKATEDKPKISADEGLIERKSSYTSARRKSHVSVNSERRFSIRFT